LYFLTLICIFSDPKTAFKAKDERIILGDITNAAVTTKNKGPNTLEPPRKATHGSISSLAVTTGTTGASSITFDNLSIGSVGIKIPLNPPFSLALVSKVQLPPYALTPFEILGLPVIDIDHQRKGKLRFRFSPFDEIFPVSFIYLTLTVI
jgi:hypothetical protein